MGCFDLFGLVVCLVVDTCWLSLLFACLLFIGVGLVGWFILLCGVFGLFVCLLACSCCLVLVYCESLVLMVVESVVYYVCFVSGLVIVWLN